MSTEFFKIGDVNVANIKNNSEMVTFGIAVKAGSIFETPDIAGISHFSEHMFFKGTKKRTWNQIDMEIARMGASNNAWTSENNVYYHITCPKYNVEKAIDIMMDMFFNSTFPEDELEKERTVILEEMQMYKDDPKTDFHFTSRANFLNWNYGHHIIGTEDTVKGINREKMVKYLEEKTNADNIVFICSGDIDTEDLKRYIGFRLPPVHPYLKKGTPNTVKADFWSDSINSPDKIKFTYKKDNIQQCSVTMYIKGISTLDKRHSASKVLLNALGGGCFSALFKRIRGELGLCYTVGMGESRLQYPDDSIIGVYGYTAEKNIESFIIETEKILKDVIANGISEELFQCSKEDELAALIRGTETSAGLASALMDKYLIGDYTHLEDSIAKLKKVTIEDCNELAKDLLNQQYNWTVMVPANVG